MSRALHPLLFLVGPGLLVACQSIEPEAAAYVESEAPTAATEVEGRSPAFAFLLGRYDANADALITPDEYTRHGGQFERWDSDGDGHLSDLDWGDEALTLMPQIDLLQRTDPLGRYFQTDENGTGVLTLDELANAFFEYEGAGTFDENLTEDEFRGLVDERVVELPGDGSMMRQSYLGGGADGWSQLLGFYDVNRSGSLDLGELTAVFEELDVYELRFDQVRFDEAQPDRDAYREGLVVGSPVPAVTLTTLSGDGGVELSRVAGGKPVALIFGSYT